MTDFENRKFVAACKQEGLNPIQEFVFGEILGVKFRSDFYFEFGNKEVSLEVDGGIWSNGRHNRSSGYIEGMSKRNAYAMLGIQQLVFTVQEIEKHPTAIIRCVKLALGFDIDAKFVFDSLYKKEREKRSASRKKKAAIKKITAAIKPLKKIIG